MISRRRILLGATSLAGLGLAGCATDGALPIPPPPDIGPPDTRFTPDAEQVGTGAARIGFLAYDEVGNLSDGTPSAVYMAGKLALGDFSGEPASLLIRRVDESVATLEAAVGDLIAQKVGVIVGPGDDEGARLVGTKALAANIPVLTLGRVGNPAQGLYGCGIDYDNQAEAAVGEMKRRTYGTVLVATNAQHGSGALGDAVARAAAAAGIAVRPARIPSPERLIGVVTDAMHAGPLPSAVLFATGPEVVRPFLAARKMDASLRRLTIVGNAGWALTNLDAAEFSGTWYAGLPLDSVNAFANKFALAYSQTPTLDSIAAYDLTVLAAALPLMAGKNPFREEVMTSKNGFTGQSGQFWLDPVTGLIRRQYDIISIEPH